MAKTNKWLVAWAHFPIGIGILGPVIVWLISKDTDPAATFQAKQALAWQMCWFTILFSCALVYMVVGLIVFAGARSGTGFNALPIFTLFGITLIISLVYMATMIWAAVSVLQNKDFKYPIIGKMLRK